nr:MAG TPA: hypothetical protein [Caudoviricetes sp.]
MFALERLDLKSKLFLRKYFQNQKSNDFPHYFFNFLRIDK